MSGKNVRNKSRLYEYASFVTQTGEAFFCFIRNFFKISYRQGSKEPCYDSNCGGKAALFSVCKILNAIFIFYYIYCIVFCINTIYSTYYTELSTIELRGFIRLSTNVWITLWIIIHVSRETCFVLKKTCLFLMHTFVRLRYKLLFRLSGFLC